MFIKVLAWFCMDWIYELQDIGLLSSFLNTVFNLRFHTLCIFVQKQKATV